MKFKQILILTFLISASSIYSMSPQEKLFRGSIRNNPELVEEALKEGANINSPNEIGGGQTALMHAANGYPKMVEKLLKAGANVNLQDINGDTALMKAIEGWQKENIVKQLLNAGAIISLKNNEGNTALDIAREQGWNNVVKILEEEQKRLRALRAQTQQQVASSLQMFPGFAELVSEYAVCPKESKKRQAQEKEDQE